MEVKNQLDCAHEKSEKRRCCVCHPKTATPVETGKRTAHSSLASPMTSIKNKRPTLLKKKTEGTDSKLKSIDDKTKVTNKRKKLSETKENLQQNGQAKRQTPSRAMTPSSKPFRGVLTPTTRPMTPSSRSVCATPTSRAGLYQTPTRSRVSIGSTTSVESSSFDLEQEAERQRQEELIELRVKLKQNQEKLQKLEEEKIVWEKKWETEQKLWENSKLSFEKITADLKEKTQSGEGALTDLSKKLQGTADLLHSEICEKKKLVEEIGKLESEKRLWEEEKIKWEEIRKNLEENENILKNQNFELERQIGELSDQSAALQEAKELALTDMADIKQQYESFQMTSREQKEKMELELEALKRKLAAMERERDQGLLHENQLTELSCYLKSLNELPTEGTVKERISHLESTYGAKYATCTSKMQWTSCLKEINVLNEKFSIAAQMKEEIDGVKKQLTQMEEEKNEAARRSAEKDVQLVELAQILRDLTAQPKEGITTNLISKFEQKSKQAKWDILGKKVDAEIIQRAIEKALSVTDGGSPTSTLTPTPQAPPSLPSVGFQGRIDFVEQDDVELSKRLDATKSLLARLEKETQRRKAVQTTSAS